MSATLSVQVPDNVLKTVADSLSNAGLKVEEKKEPVSHTGLYVGLGLGVLAVGGVAFWWFKIRKPSK